MSDWEVDKVSTCPLPGRSDELFRAQGAENSCPYGAFGTSELKRESVNKR